MIIFTYHTIHVLPRNRKAKINPKNIFIVIFSVLSNFLKNILDENVKKKIFDVITNAESQTRFNFEFHKWTQKPDYQTYSQYAIPVGRHRV